MLDTFADLPDALVRDLLARALPIASSVLKNVEALRLQKGLLRNDAVEKNLYSEKRT